MDLVCTLVDCENFYTSCERVFDPSLQEKPVAVLPNNDGCVIAWSEEVKEAGVCLYDIWPSRPHQESLFCQSRREEENLMEAVGRINREHGKGAVGLVAAGLPGGKGNLQREQAMKRQKRFPRYTTRWDELPVAHT